jgi:hypothetical protein
VWLKGGGKKGRIEVALNGSDAALAAMDSFRERLLFARSTPMAELAEFGLLCRKFEQGAARACNGASQVFYKHPWCSFSDTLPKCLLPCLVGYLFNVDGIAKSDNIMGHLPMQALAVRSQLPFFGGFAPSRLLVAFTDFPVQR